MNGNLESEKDNTVNGNRVSVVRSSLHASQVAHQVDAYLRFQYSTPPGMGC